MKVSILLFLLLFSLAVAQGGSYSYYNFFAADLGPNGYFGDGYHFNGPFRANGPINLYSSSPGRDNDVYFYTFTLSSDYYIYGTSSAGQQVSVPHYGNLWIEPYEQMEQGPPWFNLGVDPLPFGADEVDWQITRAAAQNYGLYLTSAEVPDGSRILLDDTLLMVKFDQSSAPVFYEIHNLTEPVIWVENAATDILYLKANPGASEISKELTIGCNGDIYFSGPLEYSTTAPGMLGLISVYGDGLIADTPASDWVEPFDIETEENLVYSASLLLLEGMMAAENFTQPNPSVDFTLFGGIQMLEHGFTGTGSAGFNLIYDYDDRLLTQSPPWYPEYQTSCIETETYQINNLELTVSSNPFSSSVVITSSLPGTISVLDSAGRVIQLTETEGQYMFNGSDLPEGLYIVVATDTNGNQASLKLIKF